MKIIIYETNEKKSPFADFIRNLTSKEQSKLLRDIDLLKEFGSSLREPYTKPLGNSLFELRTQFGKTSIRSLFFFYFDNQIVITNGFIKKTNKTKKEYINLAIQYRADWIRRNSNELFGSKKGTSKKSRHKS